MKTNKLVLLFLLSSLCVEAKYTAGDQQRDTIAATNQGNQIANVQNGTVAAGYQSLEQNSKDTMQNSQKGQATATILKIGMFGLSAMYAGQCGSQNYAACVKAAVLFAMGMQAKQSADSFQAPIKTSWDNTCTYSTIGCNSGTPENPYNAAISPADINTAKQNEIKITTGLKNGGYEVDINAGKIKTPNGDISTKDPGALSAALGPDGMSKLNSDVGALEKDAKAKVDQIKNAAVTAALGFDAGGGGSGVGALGEGGYGTDANAAGGAGGGLASKLDKLRKPAAKGLTKNFNGDPIGVAADSIFEMMSRRYQLKNTQKTFIGADVQSN